MFGLVYGFPLACVVCEGRRGGNRKEDFINVRNYLQLTTLGASSCYWASHFVFRRVVVRFFQQKISALHKKVFAVLLAFYFLELIS